MPTSIDIGKPSEKRGRWDIKYCEVTASQTFKVGDWVYKDTAGTLAICAASGADVGAILPWGRAAADAADVLNNSALFPDGCPVDVPGYDGEFVVAVYHSTGASAVLAATDVDGAASTITLPLRNQGGQWVANKENNGTNDLLVIQSRHPKYPWSTQYGWFWAKLKPAARLEAAS